MSHNYFGTDGIRGPITSHLFTPSFISALGRALGRWTDEHTTSQERRRIALGHDGRANGDSIARRIATCLIEHGIEPLYLGMATTPLIAHTVRTADCAYGLSITASHNGPSDNGFKIFSATRKTNRSEEMTLSRLITAELARQQPPAPLAALPIAPTATQRYIAAIQNAFTAHHLRSYRVVVDCAQGAASHTAQAIMAHYTPAELIVINNKPTGYNSNVESGCTDTRHIMKVMRESNADFGFALDGDGDRVSIIISHNNTLQELTGDQVIAFLSDTPRAIQQPIVIGTPMSNGALTSYLATRHKEFMRTDHVGDKHVWEALLTKNGFIGGEPSGHIIVANHGFCSDGLRTALFFTEQYAARVAADRSWRFTPLPLLPQVTTTLPLPPEHERINLDLIKKQFEQPGRRIIVRYSGTENKIRIMVESTCSTSATQCAEQIRDTVQQQFAT